LPPKVELIHEGLLEDAEGVRHAISLAAEWCDSMPAGNWSVSVLIAGSEQIKRLHAEFFSDPSDTDVMSFPSGDDLTAQEGYLGDIAISLDVASTQAREAGHSLAREIVYLALHGLLHLTGWEDTTEAQRQAMLDVQDTLLGKVESVSGRTL
jgi:probable rRNA maturation factor